MRLPRNVIRNFKEYALMPPAGILDISDDGNVAAGHPQRVELPLQLAPSTGNQFNTIQPHLVTVACALISDQKFEFDSSFILPEAASAFRKLVRQIKSHPGCPLSVFGHADPVNRDDYNKTLSGRRAMAVYGVLVRDTDLWEKKLYQASFGGDSWGTRSIQIMLDALGFPPGPIDGQMGKQTGDAIEAFQNAKDLNPNRELSTSTRKKLFEAYMDQLCADEAGEPFKVARSDFLAGGEDPNGKGDYQGCGEFNPVLLFSDEEDEEFKKAENREMRNQANAPNRRVIVFLFRKGTRVSSKHWPCPRAKEGVADCKKRFWSDGEDRRSILLSGQRREFHKTEDTFGCRFYHGLAAYSPCEAALKLWVIRLLVDGPNGKQVPLSGRRFAVTAGDTESAPVLRGTTDDRGILRLPVFDELVTMRLKLDLSGQLLAQENSSAAGGGGAGGTSSGSSGNAGTNNTNAEPDVDSEGRWPGEDRFTEFKLKAGSLAPMADPGYRPALQRLYNLGFGRGDPDQWDQATTLHAIRAFQHANQLKDSGIVDAPTAQKIRELHGS
jgi:peptidoglycan hydrolase-like protein with peptidoglycan-binding domain